jgi:hypothetical protein
MCRDAGGRGGDRFDDPEKRPGSGSVKAPYSTGRFARVGEVDDVSTPGEAARVVEQMLTDLADHPGEWENGTLERFLDALAASLEALPAHQPGQPADPAAWRTLAELLVKASGYQ